MPLRKLFALTGEDRRLLWQAFLSLVILRAMVTLRLTDWKRPPIVSGRIGAGASRIAWAVRIAACFVPRSTCLVRALAAQRLLARHGHASDLVIGVARPGGKEFEAHAWVEYSGSVVIGDNGTPYVRLLQWSPRT